MKKDIETRIKKLFLIDGIGALLSIFLLGVVLVKFESYFGMPKPTLYFLAFWPCLFFIYDMLCFFLAKQKLNILLKGIAFANVGYCILSVVTAIFHYSSITYLGWIYISLEIIIVLIIASIEFKVANK